MAAALLTLFALAIAAGKAIEAVTEADHDKKKGRKAIEGIIQLHNECVQELEQCRAMLAGSIEASDRCLSDEWERRVMASEAEEFALP